MTTLGVPEGPNLRGFRALLICARLPLRTLKSPRYFPRYRMLRTQVSSQSKPNPEPSRRFQIHHPLGPLELLRQPLIGPLVHPLLSGRESIVRAHVFPAHPSLYVLDAT